MEATIESSIIIQPSIISLTLTVILTLLRINITLKTRVTRKIIMEQIKTHREELKVSTDKQIELLLQTMSMFNR